MNAATAQRQSPSALACEVVRLLGTLASPAERKRRELWADLMAASNAWMLHCCAQLDLLDHLSRGSAAGQAGDLGGLCRRLSSIYWAADAVVIGGRPPRGLWYLRGVAVLRGRWNRLRRAC